jgi:hypothetical protein
VAQDIGLQSNPAIRAILRPRETLMRPEVSQVAPSLTRFRTETRALATDDAARAKPEQTPDAPMTVLPDPIAQCSREGNVPRCITP